MSETHKEFKVGSDNPWQTLGCGVLILCIALAFNIMPIVKLIWGHCP